MASDNQTIDTVAINKTNLTPALLNSSVRDAIKLNKSVLNEELALHNWSGDSSLPSELFELTHLKALTLYGFNLKSIPKELFNLTLLEELTIRQCSIKKFPIELKNLSNLVRLTLSSNRLLEIPKGLDKWHNLSVLNLEDCSFLNKLNSLPANLEYIDISGTALNEIPNIVFSLEKITKLGIDNLNLASLPNEIFKLDSLTWIYACGNQLTDIPKEISNLKNLNTLVLYNNNFERFPESIFSLKKLIILRLDANNISTIPEAIYNLKNLLELDLSNNCLTEIPKAIFALKKLREIDFNNFSNYKTNGNKNKITYLDPNILQLKQLRQLSLDATYITNVPAEIVGQGIKAIRSYFSQLENQELDYLFEAKLLVLGEPGAGKTTLTRKLEDENCPLPTQEETTRGVDVRQHYFPVNSATFPGIISAEQQRDFRLNIWDFGGQEIYKATHRFFLSDRAVYLLVANSRNEDTDFTYWLHMMEIFGGKSPLLIVINEIHNRSRSIDKIGLRGHFENIRDILFVDLDDRDKKRLYDLRGDIEKLALKLPHIGSAVPATWTTIRQAIEEDPRHVMSKQEYVALCKTHGINKATDALVLSQYFHDIGVFLHFQDDELLQKQIFLKPTWATGAVYKVLDHPLLIQQNGRFSRQDADAIWQEDEFADVKDDLLKLMQRFFLTYRIRDTSNYIVPEKLPPDTPNYLWEAANNLVLLYRYEYFMPKGLLTQFMVKKHQYITNQDMVWRRGVLMYRQDTVAEITETYDSRTIQVRLQGNNKRDFVTLIAEELDAINAQYATLQVEKLIPCNCKECAKSKQPDYYAYSDLKTRIKRGKQTIECKKSYANVNVAGLIDEIFNPIVAELNKLGELATLKKMEKNENSSTTSNKKVFISYAHANKRYLTRLLTHFKAIKHAGVEVDEWADTRLKAGSKWKEEIEQAMQECRVAILLISTDFLASDFIMTNELPTLLAAAKERGVDIIPLIVAPGDFTQSKGLSEYQSVNEPSKPLSSLSPAKRDEVYLAVTKRVRELLLPA